MILQKFYLFALNYVGLHTSIFKPDCYRLGVASYSSDPSGERIGPLVGVPEAILGHYNRITGHATPQRPSTTGKTTGHD